MEPPFTILTFAHNARNLVSDGDTVTTGTPLAIAGKTGNAEGEHIHCHLQARNVNNSGAYNPVGFSGIRNEKRRVQHQDIREHAEN
mgnify:CR=1 FL=1